MVEKGALMNKSSIILVLLTLSMVLLSFDKLFNINKTVGVSIEPTLQEGDHFEVET